MNKLHRILAAGLIAAAGGGLAAAPVLAADATTSPAESPAVQTQTPQQTHPQTKMRSTHRQHAKANRATRVERLQQALNKNGASLKVDGKWGRNTESALKSFQKDHGLKVTGRMDKATRGQLFKKS